ncbi:MAG: cupin domain-containing protein [Bacteroidetes bacterium]|nr:cupin domain-containing protein [Bacteroidota bacterium]
MVIRKKEITAIDFGGLEIFDYTAKCNDKSSFAVIRVKPNVNHQLSRSKRSDKYYYVINGNIEFLINNEIITLNEGDFCIIKKGDKFLYKNNSNEIVTLVLVHTPSFILEEEVYE